MNIEHLLGSKRFKAADVPNPITLTINYVNEELVGDEDKVVVGFAERDETVACSQTALRQLAQIFGSTDTDDWVGKKVVLYNDKSVAFDDKKVGGLRFRTAMKSETPKKDGK